MTVMRYVPVTAADINASSTGLDGQAILFDITLPVIAVGAIVPVLNYTGSGRILAVVSIDFTDRSVANQIGIMPVGNTAATTTYVSIVGDLVSVGVRASGTAIVAGSKLSLVLLISNQTTV